MAKLKQSHHFRMNRVQVQFLLNYSENEVGFTIRPADELPTIIKAPGRTAEHIRFEGMSHVLSRGGKPQSRLELGLLTYRIISWILPTCW